LGKVEGEVRALLKSYNIVGLDTMVFIYHFEGNQAYQPFTMCLFDSIENGSPKAVTSVITLMEILVKPKKQGDERLVKEYKFLLHTFPNLEMIDLGREIADIASGLRADYGIRTPDAIQLASVMLAGGEAFVTNEPGLKRVAELEVIVMKEALGI